MDKKQLTRKIMRISHISLIAMVVYVVLNIFGFFPETARNERESILFQIDICVIIVTTNNKVGQISKTLQDFASSPWHPAGFSGIIVPWNF